VRALLATGAGGLLAGSTDAAIRAWMPATPTDSYMVAAPPPPPSTAPLTDEVRWVGVWPPCKVLLDICVIYSAQFWAVKRFRVYG